MWLLCSFTYENSFKCVLWWCLIPWGDPVQLHRTLKSNYQLAAMHQRYMNKIKAHWMLWCRSGNTVKGHTQKTVVVTSRGYWHCHCWLVSLLTLDQRGQILQNKWSACCVKNSILGLLPATVIFMTWQTLLLKSTKSESSVQNSE